MNRKNLNIILVIISFVTIILPTATYAENLSNMKVCNTEQKLIAGKNIGCSIKEDTKKVEPIEKIKEQPKETKENNNSIKLEFSDNKLLTSKIPMPIEHQRYLYNLCQERNLDYTLMLSLIKQESGFNPNRISPTRDYGYMQINIVNHKNLVKELKTPNKPLDPYVNMNWGTHMISKLNNKYKKQGYSGEKLNRAVLSAYNKGEGGFKRTGEAKAYINRVNKEQKWVKKTLGI